MEYFNTDISIKSTGIKARVNNEINNLFNQCEFISIERLQTGIAIKIIKNENIYEMVLLTDYPFTVPINVKVNGFDYKKSLFTSSNKILNYLKTIYNIKCLCCHTIICSEWTPCKNIGSIINEIIGFSKIKKEIKLRLICDMVRNKGKCYFAEFEKYL